MKLIACLFPVEELRIFPDASGVPEIKTYIWKISYRTKVGQNYRCNKMASRV
jgi:hypothetical protein